MEIPRLQDLARQSLKNQLKYEVKTSEIKELYDLMASMKLINRTTREEEKQLREKYIARKVINKMKSVFTFTGIPIRIGYPFITIYKVSNIKFRLTSNDLYYIDYLKPDLLESVVKRGTKITMKLDSKKIRDCALSRHITIDMTTKEIMYYIIHNMSKYNVIERAKDNQMKFEEIK
ncbi:MAG: hypothetical protein EBU66_20655 [Bacteroidetes bacterium]|nr:hypothetical protein [bacterium]NBP67043.1 hypothetical protein [Bacteroidota bacterium]